VPHAHPEHQPGAGGLSHQKSSISFHLVRTGAGITDRVGLSTRPLANSPRNE
jgi:hypothetical protein